jgi:transposase
MIHYQVMKKMSNAFDLRLSMVRMAENEGISAAARYYRTTRRKVQRWVRRCREGGLGALQNRRRAPKRIPHKMPRELEKKIAELKKKYPGWEARRLKTHSDPPSRSVRLSKAHTMCRPYPAKNAFPL